jgi:hypothetical protein
MNEVALSLWADGSRRMIERIDDTAQRITTDSQTSQIQQPASGSPRRRVIGREDTGSASCGSLAR